MISYQGMVFVGGFIASACTFTWAMRSLCSRRSGGSSTPNPHAVSALLGAGHYRIGELA
jgi:hypothetical protein